MKQTPSLKQNLLFLFLLLCTILLSGCGDLVEIQDRDFVLALGISYDNDQYEVTYSLPDLSAYADMGESPDKDSLLRTYRGTSLREIEQAYNSNSEKRLDYRHLQVIILDASVCAKPQVMKQLLIQINSYYDISHNVLVYFYNADIRELMGMETINSSIGEHLQKLDNNNSVSGLEPAQIGALIDCLENERTLFIPTLYNRDNSIAIDGGIFFGKNHMLRSLSQPESDIYQLSMGKSKDYLMRLDPDQLIQLKEVKTKWDFDLTENGPEITLKLSGSARTLPGASSRDITRLTEAANHYIKTTIEDDLMQFMKEDNIDYLNLYEKSSYKSRRTWARYENDLDGFIENAEIAVIVDIMFES